MNIKKESLINRGEYEMERPFLQKRTASIRLCS